jgi:hypothetical protein
MRAAWLIYHQQDAFIWHDNNREVAFMSIWLQVDPVVEVIDRSVHVLRKIGMGYIVHQQHNTAPLLLHHEKLELVDTIGYVHH